MNKLKALSTAREVSGAMEYLHSQVCAFVGVCVCVFSRWLAHQGGSSQQVLCAALFGKACWLCDSSGCKRGQRKALLQSFMAVACPMCPCLLPGRVVCPRRMCCTGTSTATTSCWRAHT